MPSLFIEITCDHAYLSTGQNITIFTPFEHLIKAKSCRTGSFWHIFILEVFVNLLKYTSFMKQNMAFLVKIHLPEWKSFCISTMLAVITLLAYSKVGEELLICILQYCIEHVWLALAITSVLIKIGTKTINYVPRLSNTSVSFLLLIQWDVYR